MLKEKRTQKLIRVTFFGDSICVGQGISIYHGWVTRLAEQLDASFGSDEVKLLVTNSSVNGRTTRQALEDMPYHVQSQGVDLIVIQFGLNDCNYWLTDKGNPRVSLEAFQANIKEIITRARAFGAKKILLNTNHPTLRDTDILPHTNITFDQSNQTYNVAIRKLANDLSDVVQFQDIETHFESLIHAGSPLSNLLLEDGLHLSKLGHDEYLKFVGPRAHAAVESLLNEY